MPSWDPQQYERFADHRTRPFFDLLARVGADRPARVVDLGCGNGPLTLALADRWPGAAVTGVDSSAQMLERARNLDDRDRVTWQLAPGDRIGIVGVNGAGKTTTVGTSSASGRGLSASAGGAGSVSADVRDVPISRATVPPSGVRNTLRLYSTQSTLEKSPAAE